MYIGSQKLETQGLQEPRQAPNAVPGPTEVGIKRPLTEFGVHAPYWDSTRIWYMIYLDSTRIWYMIYWDCTRIWYRIWPNSMVHLVFKGEVRDKQPHLSHGPFV